MDGCMVGRANRSSTNINGDAGICKAAWQRTGGRSGQRADVLGVISIAPTHRHYAFALLKNSGSLFSGSGIASSTRISSQSTVCENPQDIDAPVGAT